MTDSLRRDSINLTANALLNICVKLVKISEVNRKRISLEIPSGPEAFLYNNRLRIFLTSFFVISESIYRALLSYNDSAGFNKVTGGKEENFLIRILI
jgi:hypothetical protein